MNEVKLNDGSRPTATVEFSAATDGIVVEDLEDNDDKDWVSLHGAGETLSLPHGGGQPQTISEQIAYVSTGLTLALSIPDGNPRNSSCHTSPQRQRRSHRLLSVDFV